MISDVSHTSREFEAGLGENVETTKQTLRMEVGLDVLSVDDDATARIRMTYRRVAVKVDAGGHLMDYDSADAAKRGVSDPTLLGFKGLVGQSVTFRQTSRGEVKDVQGVAEVLGAMVREFPEGPERDSKRRELSQTWNEENFARQCSFVPLLPERPVGPGDSWTSERKMGVEDPEDPVLTTVRITYKVADTGREFVVLAVTGTVEKSEKPVLHGTWVVTFEDEKSGTLKLGRDNATMGEMDLAETFTIFSKDHGGEGRTDTQKLTTKTRLTVKRE
jgi:hypothetical protein